MSTTCDDGDLLPGCRVGYYRAGRLVEGTVVLVNGEGTERLAIVWDGLLVHHGLIPVDYQSRASRKRPPPGYRSAIQSDGVDDVVKAERETYRALEIPGSGGDD